MALPKLNDTPKHELVIPSSNQKIRYRPYLVKEEKVMMMAMESQDMTAILNAVADTVDACIENDISTKELAIFDIEYLFTQIRAKSVGESSKINLKCSNKECEVDNEIDVDISSITIDVPDIDHVIKITDEISIEMKWPSYSDMLELGITDAQSANEGAFAMIAKCISAIVTEEERIVTSDVPKKEVSDFIDSMTKDQFSKVSAYIESMPKLSHTVNFDCNKCKHANEIVLEGLADFF
mgnify:FL=1|tara:strand:- start:3642 stop:4355 length:714 start_codon:yes stop_codon:yes gene_type:complete